MELPKIVIPLLPSLPVGTSLVGTGYICWFKQERHTDRYGSVWLSAGLESVEDCPSPMIVPDLGSKGQLIARILDVSIYPLGSYYATTRRIGQLVPLGEGRSFLADFDEPPRCLGVKPTTRRKYNWLSPDCLLFVQYCRVDLLWAPRPITYTLLNWSSKRRKIVC